MADSDFVLREMTPAEIAVAFAEGWGGLAVTPERAYAPSDVDGFVGIDAGGRPVATVTVHREPGSAEIVTLNALVGGHHYGRRALVAVEEILVGEGRRRLRLFTTNDNLRAITIYMRMGYRVVAIHLNAMDRVRTLKPAVPLVADNGLPLQDMWELQKGPD